MSRNPSRGPIDWAALRARVSALADDAAGVTTLSEEEARAVLEARARRLAKRTTENQDESLELVLFELGEESYAIESRFVWEVFVPADVATLPGADPPVVALTGWRGDLLALLDLRQTLGVRASSNEHPMQVLVLGETDPAFGILVDQVGEVVRISVSAVQPLSDSGLSADALLQGATDQAVLVIAAANLIRNFS